MTAVLPPAGTPGETWHWIFVDDEGCIKMRWTGKDWFFPDIDDIDYAPSLLAEMGWSYFAPDAQEPVTPPRAEGQDGGGAL